MSSSSLARGLKEELEESKGSLSETISVSATSFYNNNNHQHQPMSATALLQKAAQMGSTRSNNNNNNPATTFNDTVFGFMSTSSNSSNNMSNQLSSYGHHHNKNEVESFNDLVNSMSSSTPATTIRDGSLFSSSFLSNKHLMMNMPGAANLIKQSQSEQSSLTRDFLGVGGDAISGVPFFQQELAKLASMGDLSQYTSSGHQ
ncbi:protein indeterminate-domain 9 [Prunus yedoensis var. nudiflora]|uniref:Protein indeterminate-domain 9 n=1 Tax=Prunus yedoensis var. nudiflora TaxID=2094558 RepID=A0A314YET7_PRUYE|nr:protein indeterminate-domain 9 [Prunus yedoensis var. nudiflora]